MRPHLGAFTVSCVFMCLVVWLGASALPGGVAGAAEVERVRSYWNAEHTTIYSDVVVTNDDGSKECRQELGGTVDGIGQLMIPLYGHLTVDYVPTPSSTGAHLHWAGSCVFLTPNSRGTTALAFSDVMAALTAATDEWNDVAGACSYLRYMIDAPEAIDAGRDGRNVMVFREDRWAPGGRASETPYNPAATAITTLSFIDDASRADNGSILDTDIEINSVNFAMAVGCETRCQTLSDNGTVEDLQNTLTHELGHVLGLSHTCFVPDANHKTAPLDDQGQPAPLCSLGSLLPAAITDATMFPFQSPGEVSKRSLSQDDINGACATYPVASNPDVCEPVDLQKSGCSLTGASDEGPAGAATLAAFVAALVVVRRRGRGRGR